MSKRTTSSVLRDFFKKTMELREIGRGEKFLKLNGREDLGVRNP